MNSQAETIAEPTAASVSNLALFRAALFLLGGILVFLAAIQAMQFSGLSVWFGLGGIALQVLAFAAGWIWKRPQD